MLDFELGFLAEENLYKSKLEVKIFRSHQLVMVAGKS